MLGIWRCCWWLGRKRRRRRRREEKEAAGRALECRWREGGKGC